jgi:hypothetical protein
MNTNDLAEFAVIVVLCLMAWVVMATFVPPLVYWLVRAF